MGMFNLTALFVLSFRLKISIPIMHKPLFVCENDSLGTVSEGAEILFRRAEILAYQRSLLSKARGFLAFSWLSKILMSHVSPFALAVTFAEEHISASFVS